MSYKGYKLINGELVQVTGSPTYDWSNFATKNDVAGKQSIVPDLEDIRNNASAGAGIVSTVEAIPTTYATKAELSIAGKVKTVNNIQPDENGNISVNETDPVFSASPAAGIKASDITNWNSKTANVGTVTGIKMNGASKGTSGVVDLGTILTEHPTITKTTDTTPEQVALAHSGTFQAVTGITRDANGHVTTIATQEYKLPASGNTDTKVATSNKADTKLFLVGATAQSTSGQTGYSNVNCYIGTDNKLYSNGGAVINSTVLTNEDLDAVKTEGFYNAGGGNTVSNKPGNLDSFGLVVVHMASGDYYKQIIFSGASSYRRNCNNGTWSEWTIDKLTDTVYTHPSSGVTAGTYKSVTVNAAGHVTAGTNPSTLTGYGITDAVSKKVMAGTEDLNDIKTVGFYNCSGSSTRTLQNLPSGVAQSTGIGMRVTQIAGGNYYEQMLITSSGTTYKRIFNSSSWSDWVEVKYTDTKYQHPSYTEKSNGLYKITIDTTGHISEATAITKSDITALGIPASDTNTHYTSKNVVGSSTATSNTTSALTNGNVYINSVENGSVTSTHKISGTGATTVTTDSSGNIIINSTDTDTKYTHPTTTGNKHIPSGGASGQILRWSADGTAAWGSDNNTWTAFKGATATAVGTAGYVPAPAAGNQSKFFRGDGTWAAAASGEPIFSVNTAVTTITPTSGWTYNNIDMFTFSHSTAKVIGERAFMGNTMLLKAVFPQATTISGSAFMAAGIRECSFPLVTKIGSWVFQEARALSQASFPACTTLDPGVFYNCEGIMSISFPKLVTIGSNAFGICTGISTASFPMARTIGAAAFGNCKNLASLYLKSTTLCTLSSTGAFNATPMSSSAYLGKFGSVYVPTNLAATYKAATNWTAYSARIVGQ